MGILRHLPFRVILSLALVWVVAAPTITRGDEPAAKPGPSLRIQTPRLTVPKQQPEERTSTPRPLNETAAYLLKPLDPVQITLRGIPERDSIEDRIDETGHINLPLIGAISAAGLTTAELERRIESAYIDGEIYRHVSVNVVVPAQSYFVRGEVKQPGRFPLIGGVTLVQALAAAGGYTDYANPKRTTIIRGDETLKFDVRGLEKNPDRDVELETGDVIVVPRSVF